MIRNEKKAGVTYDRKFDIVVKIEEIEPASGWTKDSKVNMKVTDQSNILFTLKLKGDIFMNRTIEDHLNVGDVVRVVKLHKTPDQ